MSLQPYQKLSRSKIVTSSVEFAVRRSFCVEDRIIWIRKPSVF